MMKSPEKATHDTKEQKTLAEIEEKKDKKPIESNLVKSAVNAHLKNRMADQLSKRVLSPTKMAAGRSPPRSPDRKLEPSQKDQLASAKSQKTLDQQATTKPDPSMKSKLQ